MSDYTQTQPAGSDGKRKPRSQVVQPVDRPDYTRGGTSTERLAFDSLAEAMKEIKRLRVENAELRDAVNKQQRTNIKR